MSLPPDLNGLLAAWVLTAPLAAQASNDPETCPYCEGRVELMEPAGIVSHGGFEFASTDTEAIDTYMATSDIRWIETEHFEIGIALGPYKVKQKEKGKIRAELSELESVLPEVNAKAKVLDPWLRAHMYALRVEKIWDRFLEIMQVEESDFPPEPTQWNRLGKYMGNGPYVGQENKFEVILFPSQAASTTFLKEEFGLLIKRTQRWNVIARDSITLAAHTDQGNLREDPAMHAHVVFNLAINLLSGYKHYSYDTPIWISEGLAHFMGRELDPRFNSFDSSEGAVADMTRKTNWEPEVRKLIQRKGAIRMAELIALRDFSELTLEHHYTTWSMTDYLMKTHPDGYACLNDRLHGMTNDQGIPDGSNMDDKHREAFKECLGVSYPEFDKNWAEWVMANYASK